MQLPESVTAVRFTLPDPVPENISIEEELWEVESVLDVDRGPSNFYITYALHEQGDDLKAGGSKVVGGDRGEIKDRGGPKRGSGPGCPPNPPPLRDPRQL